MMFQYYQLCAGLKMEIYDAVHKVQYIWDKKSTTEDWGFFLVYAKNAFNEINQIIMLCTVYHLWPSGDLFVYN